jgi:hypothetical protein
MESLSTDWKSRGVLDDITEVRTFARIVVACPPPPRRGVWRGVLSVVCKRLAKLERRAEVLLFATSTCSNEPSASRLKLMRLKRRCRVNRGASKGLLRVSAPRALGGAESRSAAVRWRDRAIVSEVPCPARVVNGSGSSCDPHRQLSRPAVPKGP